MLETCVSKPGTFMFLLELVPARTSLLLVPLKNHRQLLLAKLQGSHPRWRSCLGCATCPLALCGQSSAMPCSAKPCLSKKGGATIALGSCKACHREHQPAIGVRFQASTLKAEFFKVYDLKQNKLCVNTGLFVEAQVPATIHVETCHRQRSHSPTCF